MACRLQTVSSAVLPTHIYIQPMRFGLERNLVTYNKIIVILAIIGKVLCSDCSDTSRMWKSKIDSLYGKDWLYGLAKPNNY